MSRLFSMSSTTPILNQVEKATSHLLNGPDWSTNMEICDLLNTDPSKAKDVVKVLKKRLAHKDSRVQLLTLTLLESMMKNCGEYMHSLVAEKDIPHEMVKIIKKKSIAPVKDRAIELLDVWQEAFGGSTGRYKEYWIACQELRTSGFIFPEKRTDPKALPGGGTDDQPAVPAGDPAGYPGYPATPLPHYPAPGLSASSSSRSYTRTASAGRSQSQSVGQSEEPAQVAQSQRGGPVMSLADMTSARESGELLSEMVAALDSSKAGQSQSERELMLELVQQCHVHKDRVTSIINTTNDEDLLRHGLALNDELQRVLEKYQEAMDARASLQLPATVPKTTVIATASAPPTFSATAPVPVPVTASFPAVLDSAEDEDDGFSELINRSSASRQPRPAPLPAPVPAPATQPRDTLTDLFGPVPQLPAPPQQQQAPQTPAALPSPTADSFLFFSPSPPPVPTSRPAFTPASAPPTFPAAVAEPSTPLPIPALTPVSRTSPAQSPTPVPPIAPAPAPAAEPGFPANPFDEGEYAAPTFHASAAASAVNPPQSSLPPFLPEQQQQQFSQHQQQYPPQQQQFPPPQQQQFPPPQQQQYPPQQQYPQYQQQQYPLYQQQQYPQFQQQPPQSPGFGGPELQNNYVAPWAMAATLPMSEQQRAYIYGSNTAAATGPAAPPPATLLALPAPPSPAPVPAAASPAYNYTYASTNISAALSSLSVNNTSTFGAGDSGVAPALPRGPLSVGANGSGSVSAGAAGSGSSPPPPGGLTAQQLAKNEDPMVSLFGDLVDLKKSREVLGVKTPVRSRAISSSGSGSSSSIGAQKAGF